MTSTLETAQARMIELHLVARGISDPATIAAFRDVHREHFVPSGQEEFAYADTPLPIEEGQTISQPYIVALMAQALRLRGGERVLEVGTGSGYAAAILSRLASEVFTIERVPLLARTAAERLAKLGFTNVQVRCGDGTLGWPEHAPYDAIAVAAGGPDAPKALLSQLAIGGRLIIPVGENERSQVLAAFTRVSDTEYRREDLGAVRFVPLIGAQAWSDDRSPIVVPSNTTRARATGLSSLVREAAEPIDDIESADIDALLDRIGDAKLVLLGESTHGTSEFYRMRARISRELITRRGFQFVAAEADWPDAARIDDYVLGGPRRSPLDFVPFSRFPTWMWRNEEVSDFVHFLRSHNAEHKDQRAGFHGLDLYSLFTSIAAVLAYLDGVDPDAARVARARYGLLTPWQRDPAAYGAAVIRGRYESSEGAVVAMLRDLLRRRVDYARRDGERFFDAAQNARVVADAERYYRAMYYGSAESWNLRDTHMFETLNSLFSFYGPNAKGIVWEHNSHVGDARATEMSARGEHNVGQLCRQQWGEAVYVVGFGTDHGTVAAAHNWDEPMEVMRVVPGRVGSFERLFHESALPAFCLPITRARRKAVPSELSRELLERAIGVVYRPATELASHYFYARLAQQFDELIWFDETSAVRPLGEISARAQMDLPDTYPFGL
jgi:protein-L-isoaspartate(D-aspartate) O-methyltransferase